MRNCLPEKHPRTAVLNSLLQPHCIEMATRDQQPQRLVPQRLNQATKDRLRAAVGHPESYVDERETIVAMNQCVGFAIERRPFISAIDKRAHVPNMTGKIQWLGKFAFRDRTHDAQGSESSIRLPRIEDLVARFAPQTSHRLIQRVIFIQDFAAHGGITFLDDGGTRVAQMASKRRPALHGKGTLSPKTAAQGIPSASAVGGAPSSV